MLSTQKHKSDREGRARKMCDNGQYYFHQLNKFERESWNSFQCFLILQIQQRGGGDFMSNVRLQVLMVMSMKITVFWDVTLCSMVDIDHHPDDEGSKLL
jgi:hypothetical protein